PPRLGRRVLDTPPRAAASVRGVLGRALLAAGRRLAGVEGAERLRLVGLALAVQQLGA
ncbi:hypothetical protein ANANG_G00305050, partial [Anguilla anguilla]